MTPEQVLTKNIMIWCGEHDMLCFHTNVGKIKFWDPVQEQERFFDTGLPKGWPDLMILTNKGKAIYCETKIRPRRPTAEQFTTIKLLNSRGFTAFVAYNMDDFTSEMEKALRIENTKK